MFLKRLEELTHRLDEFDDSSIFRAAFSLAPIGCLISREGGEILRINNRCMEILGYDPVIERKEYIKKLGWINLTHPDDVALDAEYAARSAAGEIPGYVITKRYRGRRGAWVWVKLTIRFYGGKELSAPTAFVFVEPAAPLSGRATAEVLPR